MVSLKCLTIGFQKCKRLMTSHFCRVTNNFFFEQNLLAHVSMILTTKFLILNSKGERAPLSVCG